MLKKKAKHILVIAAHPDDELLGLAGTLCRHRDLNDNINILILSNGEDSRGRKLANQKKRFSQAKRVADRLKAKLFFKNLPDNAFDSVSLLNIIKIIEKVIFMIKPDIIYTHFSNDLNVDHRLTFQSVVTAVRPLTNSFVKKIFLFETLSSTEWQIGCEQKFSPNYYVDISKYLYEKKELLSIYKDELRDYPHPRSLKGVEVLAHYRGMESGLEAAEAFEIIRETEQ
jgi:LmbE family N-acetylglucosaminyl deacetylase